MYDLIEKKKEGRILTEEEIRWMIDGYVRGEIPDYQMSAMMMAICFQGLNEKETLDLTLSMRDSGDCLDLSEIPGKKADKHSTGGVGDKTSLVLAPVIASLGIPMAKMSGRGLGHTGGTIDKLECFPGFTTGLSEEKFMENIKNIGIAIAGQTANLAPADKKLYALRDVTGTVESIPLIASSIMSKKLASGADAICLDVKVGSGAFMKNEKDASRLAELMVNIGKNCGRNMTAILTNMDEPLGLAVGNSLEVIEAIDTLNGNGPKDFTELCLEVAAHLVLAAKLAKSVTEAKELLQKQIENKEGLHTLAKLVHAQGGDDSYIYHPEKFKKATHEYSVLATQSGYVGHIDALSIGNAAMILGAGRSKIGDAIDHSVGIVLAKKVNDKVCKGDILAKIYANQENVDDSTALVLHAYKITEEQVDSKLILKIVK